MAWLVSPLVAKALRMRKILHDVAPYLAGSSTSPEEASLCPSTLALQEILLLGNLVPGC